MWKILYPDSLGMDGNYLETAIFVNKMDGFYW